MRDIKAFRERFNYWKNTGELPYDAGLPKYTGGKTGNKKSKVRKTVYRAKYSGKVYNTAREAAVDNANYLRARNLTELTNRIPVTYIGGTPQEARAEYWRQEPVMQHAVDSIAGRYKISSDALKYRLDREGFTDYQIQERNAAVTNRKSVPRGYDILSGNMTVGIDYGLDDARDYIESGKVKLINENWGDADDFENEKGRITHPVQGDTVGDNIGIVAAHLKYFRDRARKDFPNASESDLDRYAQAYYNRGEAGGKKWVLSGATGYGYKVNSYDDGKTDGKLRFSKNQQNTIRRMYNLLKEDGYDDFSIAGILGNAMQESSFNPDSISKRDYHGLLLNSRAIRNAVVATYGDHSFDSLMKYLLDWGNNNSRVRTKEHGPWLGTQAGKYKKAGYKNAEAAATAFMKTYERPVILDKNGKIIGYQEEGGRRKYARQMYDYILSNFSKNSSVPQIPERVVESVPTAVEMVETAPKWNPIGYQVPSYGTDRPYYDPTTPEYLSRANASYQDGYSFVPSHNMMLKNAVDMLNANTQLYQPTFNITQ